MKNLTTCEFIKNGKCHLFYSRVKKEISSSPSKNGQKTENIFSNQNPNEFGIKQDIS